MGCCVKYTFLFITDFDIRNHHRIVLSEKKTEKKIKMNTKLHIEKTINITIKKNT